MMLKKKKLLTYAVIVLAISQSKLLGGPPSDGQTSFSSSIQLSEGLTSNDDGVALSSGWKRLKLVTDARIATKLDLPNHRIDRSGLYQFLGFIEGRTKVQIPSRWKEVFGRAKVLANGHIRFLDNAPSAWTKLGERIGSIQLHQENSQLRLSTKTGNIESMGDGCTVLLPKSFSKDLLAKRIGDELPVSDAICVERNLFVSVLNVETPGFAVYCFEIDAEGLARELWVSDDLPLADDFYQGGTDWFTKLRYSDGRIFVFGCSDQAAFLYRIDEESHRAKKLLQAGGASRLVLGMEGRDKSVISTQGATSLMNDPLDAPE